MPDQQQTAETSCAEAMHLLSKAKHLLKNGEYEQQKEVPELDRVFCLTDLFYTSPYLLVCKGKVGMYAADLRQCFLISCPVLLFMKPPSVLCNVEQKNYLEHRQQRREANSKITYIVVDKQKLVTLMKAKACCGFLRLLSLKR